MKYIVIKKDNNKKKVDYIKVNGFNLPSKKSFKINDTTINFINITDNKMAYPFASKVVINKYNKLIKKLTELLIDDEDGSSTNQIIQSIEEFRLEIKEKYRKYLKKKELEEMATKLKFINDQALRKRKEIINSYYSEKTSNRSK